MSATGIGAAVRRKEDIRFITGKGQYTDDVTRPGETRAVFVRSPHAHAKIKSIDVSAAKKMPGVVAVLTGAAARHRQDRQPDLRLDDPFQGRLADEDGAASGARGRQGQPRRRRRRGRDRRDAGAGARRGREGEGRLRGAAGGGRSGQGQIGPADPRDRAQEHDLRMVARRRQGCRRRLRRRQARHQARHRQQPAGAERDRAARGDRRIRRRHRPLHALEHLAEPARGAAGDLGLRRHGARAQAARDRARRRRRLRLEDFHLSGGGRLPVGGAQGEPAGEVDGDRSEAFLTDAHGRDHVTHAELALDEQRQDSGAARQDHRQSRRLYVDVLVVGADLSLRHAAVGPVRHPADLLRGGRGLHQHRAGRCLSRRRAAGSDLRGRAAGGSGGAPDGHRSGRFAQAQLHQIVPAPDAGDHGL